MADTVSVTQADIVAAENWRFIECRHCSEYGGNFVNDLAEDFARHRLASTQPAPAFPSEDWRTLVHAVASLRAAISLLEGGGKKAAPSDKMFTQMLKDYHAAADKAAALLQGKQP